MKKLKDLGLIYVNHFDGRRSILELISKYGIKHLTSYYCFVEYKRKKGESITVANTKPPEKFIHTYGIVFNDVFEIYKIDVSVFNLLKNDYSIAEIKKRP